jgi:hypothetical protein
MPNKTVLGKTVLDNRLPKPTPAGCDRKSEANTS